MAVLGDMRLGALRLDGNVQRGTEKCARVEMCREKWSHTRQRGACGL